MKSARLEAFSDGVLAVIITIMVLEMKAPHGTQPRDLLPLIPVLFSYVLSFIYIGIYWSNHHHLFQAAERVNGGILWANLHLLFWLSLVPLLTGWMGENIESAWPVACYGGALFMAAVAYWILVRLLIAHHGKSSKIAQAIGTDFKGRLSLVFYAAGVPLAFVSPALSWALYALVACMWLVPDRRIEKTLEK